MKSLKALSPFVLLWGLGFAPDAFGKLSDEHASLLEVIREQSSALQTAEGWQSFLKKYSKEFPVKENKPTDSVTVTKVMINSGKDEYTVGLGLRQVYLAAPIEKVCQILQTPERFRQLYGLDADSFGNTATEKAADLAPAASCEPRAFQARLVKKVPVIENQDFTLDYAAQSVPPYWFQRAKLVEDAKDFALRDNTVILEKSGEGTLLREVSYVYILRWVLRALGPQVRSVTETELKKISSAQKCAAESSSLTEVAAAACWKKAN